MMKNKIYYFAVWQKKRIRVLYSKKHDDYYLELNDTKKLFNIKLNELPKDYQNYFANVAVEINGKNVILAGVCLDDLVYYRNFSKEKDASIYYERIKIFVSDLRGSYSGLAPDMILKQEELNQLISANETKTKKITILETKLEDASEMAKRFLEFTGNSRYIPLSLVHKTLKYPCNYVKIMALLRTENAFNLDNKPNSNLIEDGYFRLFEWRKQIGDKVTNQTQVMVTAKGIRYLNNLLEKSAGKK